MSSLEFAPKLTSTSAAWLRSRGNPVRLRTVVRARTGFHSSLAIHASELCEINGQGTCRTLNLFNVLAEKAIVPIRERGQTFKWLFFGVRQNCGPNNDTNCRTALARDFRGIMAFSNHQDPPKAESYSVGSQSCLTPSAKRKNYHFSRASFFVPLSRTSDDRLTPKIEHSWSDHA